MYPFGIYMNKKNIFFSFLWLFLCLRCMYLEKLPTDFLRGVFSVCLVPIPRSETWTKTVDVFIRSVTKPYALDTAICGITGLEIECWFQWCKRRGLLQTSLVARTLFSRKLAKKTTTAKRPQTSKTSTFKMKLNPYPFEWGMGLMVSWPMGHSQANKRPQ